MGDPFPLHLPADARRLFQSESLLRRFAFAAQWDDGSHLMELCGSLGGLALAKALKCRLTVLEANAKVAEYLNERCKAASLGTQVRVKQQADVTDVSGVDDTFDGIFCLGRVVGHVDTVAGRLRPLLRPATGRVAVTTIVKGGRRPNEAALAAWHKRLGRPVLTPRDAMMAVEAKGFEPEMCESLGEAELEEFYRELTGMVTRGVAGADAGLRDEVAWHKSFGPNSGVTYAVVIARRKELGEKPPLSRDGG
jgi:hypothetical protein